MIDKPTNIQYLDTLRALATLSVIVVHISSPLVNMTWNRNLEYWWIGNMVNSAARFAVPLFLMLSGATMLGKEYPLGEFYRKRMMRVLVPFLFWLVPYLIFRWSMLPPRQQPHELQATLNWAIQLFLREGVSKHFWYIYMILFIYLVLPFVGKFIRKLNNTTILIILAIWVFLAFNFRNTPMNMYSWSGDYGSKLLAYSLNIGYLILGYYLTRISLPWSKMRLPALFLFVLTIAFSSVGTYIFSKNAHKLDLSLYGYLMLNTIIQSIAIFVIIKEIKIENQIVSWIQKNISDYSYGIYLVHIMIIGILFRNGIYWSFAHPSISLPLLTLMVLVISFGIIFVLRKIPGGKYVAG